MCGDFLLLFKVGFRELDDLITPSQIEKISLGLL